jgi:hypothetical protein
MACSPSAARAMGEVKSFAFYRVGVAMIFASDSSSS